METANDEQRLVFSEELFQSLYPMLCGIIAKETAGVKIDSHNLWRFEDYVDHCRILMWEHIDKYKPIVEVKQKDGSIKKVKVKFSTYMNMVWSCRLGTYRNCHNNARHKKGIIEDFTNSKYNSYFQQDDSEKDISQAHSDYLIMNDANLIDIKMGIEKIHSLLSPEEFEIYSDHFIKGYTPTELVKKHQKFKYNQLRSIIDNLKKLHEQMVGKECH